MVFIALKVYLERFKKLGSSLVPYGGWGVDKGVEISSRLEFKVKLVTFVGEETKFAFKFITTLYVGNVTTLEWGKFWVKL